MMVCVAWLASQVTRRCRTCTLNDAATGLTGVSGYRGGGLLVLAM